jgi:hypothetical protein
MASNLQSAALSVFAGSIDSADATKLACSLVEAFDDKDGVIRKGGKEFVGFMKYAEHIGAHDDNAQIASSVIFKQSFLKKLSNDVWSELYKVYNDVSSKVGNAFEIVAAHVLFSKNQSVCFEYHQDTRDHAKNVDLSVVVQLSASKTTFNVAGFDSFSYAHSGAFFAFPSCLWHRSGIACNDTIKIAFFFRVNDPAEMAMNGKRARDDAIDVEEAGSSESHAALAGLEGGSCVCILLTMEPRTGSSSFLSKRMKSLGYKETVLNGSVGMGAEPLFEISHISRSFFTWEEVLPPP